MRKPAKNAFTLIEILAAAVILTASLAVIAASMGNSFTHFRSARLEQIAQELATEKLELAARNVQTYPANGTKTEMTVNFDWQLRLITPATGSTAAVTKLVCDVSWPFRKTAKTITLERVITPLAAPTAEATQK